MFVDNFFFGFCSRIYFSTFTFHYCCCTILWRIIHITNPKPLDKPYIDLCILYEEVRHGKLKREKITLYQFLHMFPDESAADKTITFLIARDERFEKTKQVFLQLSVTGRRGDDRNREIGISAFQITWISAKFGKEWFNVPCSDLYFQDIKPVFEVLSRRGGIYHRKKRDFMFPF